MYINEKVMLISIKHTVADHTCAVRAYDQCNKDAKTKDELYGIVDRRGPALPIAVVVAISQHALAHHDHHHPIKNESPPLHCTFKQLKRIFTNNCVPYLSWRYMCKVFAPVAMHLFNSFQHTVVVVCR
jgi:hypothetical protein